MKKWIGKQTAGLADAVMCGMMNSLQWQLRHLACSPQELEAYLNKCQSITREEFYSAPAPKKFIHHSPGHLLWESPLPGLFEENNLCTAEIFPSANGPEAPTLILLHALMSANARGYRKLAARLAASGWNVAFPHLPYHYRRRPSKFPNGALAITANLITNGETLRQAVVECRQLMQWFRERGSKEFALIGTSYGGWVGALASSLEQDWKFVALLQPIANVRHAIWESPAAGSIRKILRARGIGQDAAERHAHLSSPLHCVPRTDPARIFLCGGEYDTVSPFSELANLSTTWSGSRLFCVPQGHFGYLAMQKTLQEITPLLEQGNRNKGIFPQ